MRELSGKIHLFTPVGNLPPNCSPLSTSYGAPFILQKNEFRFDFGLKISSGPPASKFFSCSLSTMFYIRSQIQILVLLPFHPETCSPSGLTNPLVAYELAMLLEEKPTAVDRLRWIAAVLRLNNVGSVFPLCQLCSGSGSIPTLADTATVHRRQLRQ